MEGEGLRCPLVPKCRYGSLDYTLWEEKSHAPTVLVLEDVTLGELEMGLSVVTWDRGEKLSL